MKNGELFAEKVPGLVIRAQAGRHGVRGIPRPVMRKFAVYFSLQLPEPVYFPHHEAAGLRLSYT